MFFSWTTFLSGGGDGESGELRMREEIGDKGEGGLMGEGRVVGYLIWVGEKVYVYLKE